jgi:hypothetical protein
MKNISIFYWWFIDNLSYKLDKLANTYYMKSIGPEYEKEYRKFGILKENKVLHVGSGAFPLTEIKLAETIGSTVVGIDKNLNAVKSANDIVNEKNLNDKIKINYGNGIDYPVDEFDVIIISSCASPMMVIVKHILKAAKNHSKIIVREMETSLIPLIEYIGMQQDIYLVEKIDHHPFPFLKPFGWQSFHLIKEQ